MTIRSLYQASQTRVSSHEIGVGVFAYHICIYVVAFVYVFTNCIVAYCVHGVMCHDTNSEISIYETNSHNYLQKFTFDAFSSCVDIVFQKEKLRDFTLDLCTPSFFSPHIGSQGGFSC